MFALVARASRTTQFLVVPVLCACELKHARAHLSQRSRLICAHCGCLSVLWCIYLKIFETHAIRSRLSCKERIFMFTLVARASRATQLLLDLCRAHAGTRLNFPASFVPIAPARPCVIVFSLNTLKHTRYAHNSHAKRGYLCLHW